MGIKVSTLPPELYVRAPAQDMPRHSLDENPTIAGSERLSNGPTACEGAACNVRSLNVDVPDPGEAEDARDGTLPNNACHSTHSNELFHSTESPQLDAHKPSPLTPLLPPDECPPDTDQEHLPDNPTTRAECVSNIRSSNIDIPDAGEAGETALFSTKAVTIQVQAKIFIHPQLHNVMHANRTLPRRTPPMTNAHRTFVWGAFKMHL